jgi:hypothetical protein
MMAGINEATRIIRLKNGHLSFDCPGCGMMHSLNIDKPERHKWSWNNDLVRPPFSPSILVRWTFGDTFTTAKFSDGFFTAQSVQNSANLFFC